MNTNISKTELFILRLMIGLGGDQYGRGLVENSNGILKEGSIYVHLNRMVKKGFLDSRFEYCDTTRGTARKYYWITGLGEETLRNWSVDGYEPGYVTI